MTRDEILEYPYQGTITRIIEGHGDEDDTVPLEDSRRMAQCYQHCELAVMSGETHHFDRHPEQMQSIIRNWMEKLR